MSPQNPSDATTSSPTPTISGNSSATAKPKSDGGLAGAVAGAAIGALIAGALLALLATCFFMKKKMGPGGASHRRSRREKQEYGSEARTVIRPEVKFEENLPERVDDSEIRKSTQDLNEIIDLHCENYFHLKSVDLNPGEVEQSLMGLGYNSLSNSGPSATELVALLQNPQSRLSAVRLLVSLVVLGHIDWKTPSKVSLLPPHIASFLEKIPPVEKQPDSQDIFDQALDKWRHLSSFLLEPIRSNRETPKANEADLRNATDENVKIINGVLKPFIKPGPETERSQENNLRAIIFEGAQLGLLFFSQPSIWVRSWKQSSRQAEKHGSSPGSNLKRNRTLVVFPAMGELTERHGAKRFRLVTEAVEVGI